MNGDIDATLQWVGCALMVILFVVYPLILLLYPIVSSVLKFFLFKNIKAFDYRISLVYDGSRMYSMPEKRIKILSFTTWVKLAKGNGCILNYEAQDIIDRDKLTSYIDEKRK